MKDENNLKESIIFLFEDAISDLRREANNVKNDLIEYVDAYEVLEWLKGWVFDPLEDGFERLQAKEEGEHEE